jgi:hypothetical protein
MNRKTIRIFLSIVILFIGFQQIVSAQPLSEVKERPYYMWLSTMDGRPGIKGFLLDYNDSLIVVTDQYHQGVYDYPVANIHQLQFRKRGSGLSGFLVGTTAGALLGYAAGYSSGDDPPCSSGGFFCIRWSAEEKGATGAVFGALLGAGFGAIIGGSKAKYKVGGNQRNYLSFQPGLAKYTLKF